MHKIDPSRCKGGEHLEYWCNKCDAAKVDSRKPETGQFYQQFGHMFPGNDTEYVSVIFALCPNCGHD